MTCLEYSDIICNLLLNTAFTVSISIDSFSLDKIGLGGNLLGWAKPNLVNNLRDKGILLSVDGPYNNVIKIKPPLSFNKNDVNFVCFEINNYLLNK